MKILFWIKYEDTDEIFSCWNGMEWNEILLQSDI